MRVLRLLQRRLFPSGEKKGLQIVKVNNNAHVDVNVEVEVKVGV